MLILQFIISQGCMLIENEYECSLNFSFPKDVDKNGIKNDWSCPKVFWCASKTNFLRLFFY